MLTDERETKKGIKRSWWHFFKRFWMDFAHMHINVYYAVFRKPRVHFLDKEYKIKGGAMLCPNHTSFDDPLVLHAAIFYRRIYYMASELALRSWWRKMLLGGAGCVKVDRNISDIESVRRVSQLLKWGYLVGVFPQGTVYRDQSFDREQLKSGAILIALQAKAPVIPIYLAPFEGNWKRRDLVIGNPIHLDELCTKKFPSMKDIDHMTDTLYDAMMRCREYYEENVLPNKTKG